MTEKLVAAAEGKVTIPPRLSKMRGLSPGDELTLVEADGRLLVYRRGADLLTDSRCGGLNEEDRRQAGAGAERDERLSEDGRDRVWSGREESIGDEGGSMRHRSPRRIASCLIRRRLRKSSNIDARSANYRATKSPTKRGCHGFRDTPTSNLAPYLGL